MGDQFVKVGSVKCPFRQYVRASVEERFFNVGTVRVPYTQTSPPENQEAWSSIQNAPPENPESQRCLIQNAPPENAERVLQRELVPSPKPNSPCAAIWDMSKLFVTFADKEHCPSAHDLIEYLNRVFSNCIDSVDISRDRNGYIFATALFSEGHCAEEVLEDLPSRFLKIRGKWVLTVC